MDVFLVGLTISLVVAVLGILFRIAFGCRSKVGDPSVTCCQRGRAVLTGPFVALTVHLPRTIAAMVADVLLLARTGQRSLYRWVMHVLILAGFAGLLLFHAMDSTITVHFFSGYESPLDPWQWLRNLAGGMVLAGVVMAVVRRLRGGLLKQLSTVQDWALIALVGAIICSGLLLESVKLTSEAVYDRMVEDYGYVETDEEIAALKAYWAGQGVVFSAPVSHAPEVLELGAQLNEDNCSGCHADTSSAFLSRPMASLLSPAAAALNAARADLAFYWLHVGLCFLGVALLPWGKFLHPISTTANLIARGINRRTEVGDLVPHYAEARRNLGLDACTRCGECSLHCSVLPAFTVLGNTDILPSEKLADLKRHALNPFSGQTLLDLAEGSRICTECHRCTELCSAGIDLQDIWMTSKKLLMEEGVHPHPTVRGRIHDEGAGRLAELFSTDVPHLPGQNLADQSESFLGCVQCTTCTSVCPVVAVSEDATRDLDLMPQQIMNLLRMGLKDRAMSARMVWNCTTCYKCQEHCPQNIRVADILFELRNAATARLRSEEGEQ